MEFSKDPRLALDVHAYSIPDNSIIVKGGKELDYNNRFKIMISGKATTYPLPINSKVLVKEPRFQVELAKEYPKNKDGLPIVSGIVPVKVTVHPDDKDVVVNSRFELVYYVDTIFLYEDEQAYTPFTYKWDTTALPKGEHIYTINLLGYNMSVGVKSIKIYKE